MKRLVTACVAIVLSALLWFLGTGLHPLPCVAFLAPLPVLLLASRASGGVAFLAGLLSWLGGACQFWPYFTGTLEQPPVAPAVLLGGTSVAFGLLVLLTRALLVRNRPGPALLALPVGWVTVEYLISVFGSIGAWWSLAYTQTDVLPVIQSAALTGPWGITFLIMLPSSAIAVLTAPNVTRAQRLRLGSGTAALLTATLAFGYTRMALPTDSVAVRVGLVALAQPDDYVPVDSAAGQDMVARAVTEIDRLADQGAEVVVLPEKAWRATESTLPMLSGPLTEVAARRHTTVVAGLVLARPEAAVNAAIAYPSGVVYAKHYLIPGLEDELRPGTAWQQVPGTSWSLAICYDLDRPSLVRANRNRGATLMLVPALDFTVDKWLHSRMAVLRGVESGVGVARAAQLGELVVGDATGRVVASAATDTAHDRTVIADIPQPTSATLYARFGDWFGWLAAVLAAACAAAGFAPARRTAPAGAGSGTVRVRARR
ncbi:nitrilase-related carbon-nitrogen hydrolase [Nocardia sp. bgisy118]|uniref:nitrilase-related carbon-nitrogen hydrolase n=1 Tax=Nocardia sp. bgisy118 TaxID=3413786 RepID=UPI003F49ED8E